MEGFENSELVVEQPQIESQEQPMVQSIVIEDTPNTQNIKDYRLKN